VIIGTSTLTRTEPEALTPGEIDEVWRFTSRFVQRSRPLFDRMLRSRDAVYRLHDRTGELRGLAASTTLAVEALGRRATVVFGSMATVDPSFRGAGIVHLVALDAAVRAWAHHPRTPVFGVVAASSFVPFLAVARSCRTFWPHPEQRTPPFEAAVLDAAMRALTARVPGRRWVPERGVVAVDEEERWGAGMVHALEPTAHRPPELDVYARLNPEQHRGDALAMLVPFGATNLMSIAAAATRRLGRRTWRAARGR
jgi:hypothetical protein